MRTRVGWRIGLSLLPVLVCAIPLLLGQDGGKQGKGKRRHVGAQQSSGDSGENLENDSALSSQGVTLPSAPRAGHFVNNARQRQSPFLAELPDRSSALGWIDWEPGRGDRILQTEIKVVDEQVRPKAPRAVSAALAEVVRPIGALDAAGRLHVFWTELHNGKPQLCCARRDGDDFSEPVALTDGSAPCMNVEPALHSDGTIYVAWEAELPSAGGATRSSRDIYVAPLVNDSSLGPAVKVSDGRFGDLDPRIVSVGKKLAIAWTSDNGRDFDVLVREFDPRTGELGPVLDVSDDPWSDDEHPALAVAPNGELWIAWDHVEVTARGCSTPAWMRTDAREAGSDCDVHCACIRDGRVFARKSATGFVDDVVQRGPPHVSASGGVPQIAFDAAGHLWIAYRRWKRKAGNVWSSYGYSVVLQHLGASGWSPPVEIEHSGGLPEEPPIVRSGDGVVVAFQDDQRLEATQKEMFTIPEVLDEVLRSDGVCLHFWYGASGIGVAQASIDAASAEGVPELAERPAPPHVRADLSPPEPVTDPLVTGDEHFVVTRGEQKWNVYFGDLHRHSCFSRCTRGMEPRASDRWESARDVLRCDFMALTDHSGHIDPLAWWQLDKLCLLYRTPTFCTLAGYEWSTDRFGHHNVILRDRLSPFVGDDFQIGALYSQLPRGSCLTIPHHSAEREFPNDFGVCDDRFTRLIEVYQAVRGNFEFDGCFKQGVGALAQGCFVQDALNEGHKFGIIASTDHGYGQSYACALAEKLEPESIFDALYARRTYAATAKAMLIDLRVSDTANGAAKEAIMGEELECSGAPKITLAARGAAELADVVVYKNGAIFQSTRHDGTNAIGNNVSPMRLVVRRPASPPDRDFRLAVRAIGARLDPVITPHREGPGPTIPKWHPRDDGAVFTWPARLTVAGGGAGDDVLHVFGAKSARLAFECGEQELERTVDELLREPVTFAAAGVSVTVALELGDGTIDVAAGLGTRDFHGEWIDAELGRAPAWYYARFIQVDGEMAWSSPVFVSKK